MERRVGRCRLAAISPLAASCTPLFKPISERTFGRPGGPTARSPRHRRRPLRLSLVRTTSRSAGATSVDEKRDWPARASTGSTTVGRRRRRAVVPPGAFPGDGRLWGVADDEQGGRGRPRGAPNRERGLFDARRTCFSKGLRNAPASTDSLISAPPSGAESTEGGREPHPWPPSRIDRQSGTEPFRPLCGPRNDGNQGCG